MADNADPHPAPDLPDTGPVPHFPVGTPKPLRSPPPQPSVQENEEVPGEDYPPARQPFPDNTPDPGITHQ
jgi:hypothetical protein